MPDIKKFSAFILAVLFSASLIACQDIEPEINSTTQTENSPKISENSVTSTLGETTTTVSDSSADTTNIDDTTEIGDASKADISRTTNKNGSPSDSFIKSLEGFTLKILYPYDNLYSNKKSQKLENKAKKEVEKLYGVKIVEKSLYNDYTENLAAELASGNCENHIYYAKNNAFASYFKNGYLADLTPAMLESGVSFNEPWYISDAKGFLNIDGKQYGWLAYEENFTMPNCIFYNKNLIKKKNLVDPAELASQGKWTWNKLREYAGKYYNDKNVSGFVGNGINLVAAIAKQYDTSFTKVGKGTQPTTNINDSKVLSALSEYSEWTFGGSFWCETFSDKPENYAIKRFAKGKIAMIYGGFDVIKSLKGKNIAKNIGVVPFPTKEESDTYTNIVNPDFVTFVPANCQDDAAKVLFVRNEYYRAGYSNLVYCITSEFKTYLKNNEEAVSNAFDIKFGRKGNNVDYCWTEFCEDDTGPVTTESIVRDVENGSEAVEDIISNKKNILTGAYANIWKGHRTTGNV